MFRILLEKFKGNVVHVRRSCVDGYGYETNRVVAKQWAGVLGKNRIVTLESDLSIGDVVVGVIALLSGSRTLAEYVEDVKNRPLTLGDTKFEPQSPERIAEIERALTALDGYCEQKFGGKRGRGSQYDLAPKQDDVIPTKARRGKKATKPIENGAGKTDKPKKEKPGRLF